MLFDAIEKFGTLKTGWFGIGSPFITNLDGGYPWIAEQARGRAMPWSYFGVSLERLLLTVTCLGLQYSLMNQPVEIESLRDRVWLLAGSHHPPQAMIRIGRGHPAVRPMPRRRLEAVLR